MVSAMRRAERWFLGLLACVLLVLIGVSMVLRPDPSGLGTHQQLGLPACTSVQLLDLRCPACGMTTSWAWMARGRIDRALESNVGGAMLFVVTAVSIPWICWIAYRGSRADWESWLLFAVIGVCTAMAVALLSWGWLIAQRGMLL
jgi:hypothetical protein